MHHVADLRRVLLATAVVAGAEGGSAVAQDRVITSDAETLITTASGLIGSVNDMIVSADGRVYVADRQANVIYVVGVSGGVERTIGRRGAGPGEFNLPTNLSQKGDTLRVVDWGNGRLQLLSLDGEPLGTERLAPAPFPPVFGPSGSIVSPTAGFRGDTTLAVMSNGDFSERARIGRTIGISPNPVNMAAMRDQIRDGDVPPIMLNTAEVDLDPNGGVWLTVSARATVEHFDSDGRSRWLLEVEDPGFEDVRRRFFTENAAAEPIAIFALRYV
ncbi:MAG: 6-bladed beta-propeller [Gemmatimonadales bacterium]